ncbi:hypothetical protein [Lysobacter solisilvae (ex Woo and Kim 2020)]|uniref:Uncharacterized protein n=1 Tax=Agrilutibacter terrestris TaxID=2865112 RepID=A0A7H0FWA9_9GAMM|nr:hypothetical protein [Lysobacter terrestris]QNP40325.1 hypothetical protein H8B22_12690 [Lysobacter terrestris]
MKLVGTKTRILGWTLAASPVACFLAGKLVRLVNHCDLASASECYTPAAWAHGWEGLAFICLFSLAPLGILALVAERLARWHLRWSAREPK